MELSIRTRDFELTRAFRAWVTRRLAFALAKFKDHIEDISVYLMDLNGPKGGVDKLCQVRVRARGIGYVTVRATGKTFDAVVNRAARRLKYRLAEGIRSVHTPLRKSVPTAQAAA